MVNQHCGVFWTHITVSKVIFKKTHADVVFKKKVFGNAVMKCKGKKLNLIPLFFKNKDNESLIFMMDDTAKTSKECTIFGTLNTRLKGISNENPK